MEGEEMFLLPPRSTDPGYESMASLELKMESPVNCRKCRIR